MQSDRPGLLSFGELLQEHVGLLEGFHVEIGRRGEVHLPDEL